jgi:signal transduction histidine kinase
MADVAERERQLTLASWTDPAGITYVSVPDTGNGIDAADRARVLEPFVTTKKTGTGPGLSICRFIIETHGGELTVSQRLPHGSCFQFTVATQLQPDPGNVTIPS